MEYNIGEDFEVDGCTVRVDYDEWAEAPYDDSDCFIPFMTKSRNFIERDEHGLGDVMARHIGVIEMSDKATAKAVCEAVEVSDSDLLDPPWAGDTEFYEDSTEAEKRYFHVSSALDGLDGSPDYLPVLAEIYNAVGIPACYRSIGEVDLLMVMTPEWVEKTGVRVETAESEFDAFARTMEAYCGGEMYEITVTDPTGEHTNSICSVVGDEGVEEWVRILIGEVK